MLLCADAGKPLMGGMVKAPALAYAALTRQFPTAHENPPQFSPI